MKSFTFALPTRHDLARCVLVCLGFWPLIATPICYAQCDPFEEFCDPVALIGDFNADGIVSHADYTVLGDQWELLGAFGPQVLADYRANYGRVSGSDSFPVVPVPIPWEPAVAPFTITASETLHGNTQWVFAISNVTAFAGHVNITLEPGSRFINVGGTVGGAAFQSVPGVLAGTFQDMVREGIYHPQPGDSAAADLLVALGTTLGQPLIPGSKHYLTVVTNGLEDTTLTLEGSFGYQGRDHTIYQTASFGSNAPGASPSNPVMPNEVTDVGFVFADAPSVLSHQDFRV